MDIISPRFQLSNLKAGADDDGIMFKKTMIKYVASVVVICYYTMCSASHILAAPVQSPVNSTLLAQTSERGLVLDGAETPKTPTVSEGRSLSPEEQRALQEVYIRKIDRLESEIDKAKGVRKNLLTFSIAAFSIGAASTLAVDSINDAIKKIPTEDETWTDGSLPYEIKIDSCVRYLCYTREKQDALNSLGGIKGLGGGVFGVGLAGSLGYLLYTWNIRSKQNNIDTIRSEMATLYEINGLTPAYLQRNESVAAVLEEIETLKLQIGSNRTIGDIFSRVAIGGLACGAFLFGVAVAMEDIVQDIDVDQENPEQVTAKDRAIDDTKDLQKISYGLLGAGAASGLVSLFFEYRARKKENAIDELENSLLRVADRINFQPKANGFAIMYTQHF